MRGKFEDITGQTFGRLTAIERVNSDRNGNTQYRFVCSCGSEIIALSGNVRTGKTQSCGCLQIENYENSKLESGIANRNRVWRQYKNNAKLKGLEFSILIEDFEEASQQLCFYCGDPPTKEQKDKSSNGGFVYNGIDRIDNSKGYTLDNVVSCCWNCNRMKGNMTFEEFINHIHKIAGYRPPRYVYTTELTDGTYAVP